jgi:hypothetical protein
MLFYFFNLLLYFCYFLFNFHFDYWPSYFFISLDLYFFFLNCSLLIRKFRRFFFCNLSFFILLLLFLPVKTVIVRYFIVVLNLTFYHKVSWIV